jgi:hypothetical protein
MVDGNRSTGSYSTPYPPTLVTKTWIVQEFILAKEVTFICGTQALATPQANLSKRLIILTNFFSHTVLHEFVWTSIWI